MTTAPASPDEATANRLRDAASRWGTPLYVTDLDVAGATLDAYQAAFPGALIAYAVKANTDPRLLARMAEKGAGAEVVNEVELALARRAGIPGERIVMNGVGKTDADHEAAREAGALINAESLAELDSLLARYPGSVLAADARVRKFRTLARLGRAEQARAAAEDYLRHHPEGFAAGEARKLVAPQGSPP